MKLYKQMLSSEDVPPESELIMEANNRDVLKRKAEALAASHYDVLEFAWVFEGADLGYTELTVDGRCRFIVKP